MKGRIRLSPYENSIAVITDDGDFVYGYPFKPADTYSKLLVQLKSDIKLSISVSIKGRETASTGMITNPRYPLNAQLTLRRDLQAALNHSILAASDGQCLAVAARSILQLNNKLNVFALPLNQFVCGGMIVSDKLLSGLHGLIGDWGHLSLPWLVDYELYRKMCVCGRAGCLEHLVGLEGVSHDYEVLTGNKLTA